MCVECCACMCCVLCVDCVACWSSDCTGTIRRRVTAAAARRTWLSLCVVGVAAAVDVDAPAFVAGAFAAVAPSLSPTPLPTAGARHSAACPARLAALVLLSVPVLRRRSRQSRCTSSVVIPSAVCSAASCRRGSSLRRVMFAHAVGADRSPVHRWSPPARVALPHPVHRSWLLLLRL